MVGFFAQSAMVMRRGLDRQIEAKIEVDIQKSTYVDPRSGKVPFGEWRNSAWRRGSISDLPAGPGTRAICAITSPRPSATSRSQASPSYACRRGSESYMAMGSRQQP